jgi:tRNA A37 threonylcarbamoyladenosine synthetase subunit TsaC/SUA5/YrdC
MVENFEWLEINTSLNKEQIEFLKNYKRPFTIMTDCPRIKMIFELDQDDFKYENKDEYKKIAFRVAHNDYQKKLISEIGPIFLTSANYSGEKEIYDTNEAKKQFEKYLKEITFIPENFEIK